MENIFVELTEQSGLVNIISMKPLFTRYLYIVDDVYFSLSNAIRSGTMDTALFWAYELYYSGFQRELIKYLQDNFLITNIIKKIITTWNMHTYKDNLIASIIVRLCTPKNKLMIMYEEKDIIMYKTLVTDNQAWKVLKTVSTYATDKPVVPEREQWVDIFRNNWMYYAGASTPVWKERISKYGGSFDEINKEIHWMNDSRMEMFHEIFDYEPDEQSLDILHKHIMV